VVGGEYRQQGKAKLNGTLIEKERLHQKARVWHGMSNKEHTISEGIFMETKKYLQRVASALIHFPHVGLLCVRTR
jgi:hypothetical protein